jgi:hypothetical protein
MKLEINIDLQSEGDYDNSIAELIRDAIERAVTSEVTKAIKDHRGSIALEAQKIVKDAIKTLELSRNDEVVALVKRKLKELNK